MKNQTFANLFLSVALASTALGDAGTIMKQKARDFNNRDRTGENPPAAPAKPATPSKFQPGQPPAKFQPAQSSAKFQTTPVSAAQQESLKQMLADLSLIRPGTAVTADQKEQVRKTLVAAAQGDVKPALASVTKLAYDLAVAWPAQKLNSAEQTQLARNTVLILNSAGQPIHESQALANNAHVILRFSGMAQADAQKITGDLRAIIAELHK